MSQVQNPIENALLKRGILIPESPVDLSSILKSSGILRSYIVCITGRCGSTWLATALAQMPDCGNPLEYFSEEGIPHYGKPDESGRFGQFVASVIEQRKTGQVFGLKIDGLRLEWLSVVCDLERSFPSSASAWVDMRRLNIVKQAFSFARAKQSGIWHVQVKDQDSGERMQKAQTEFDISDQAIWKEIIAIIRSEKAMDRFYMSAGLHPLRIVYEEMLDSKSTLMLRVLAHLFPKRSFLAEEVMVVDDTQKIASPRNEMAELKFIEHNAKRLNVIYSMRCDPFADANSIVEYIPESFIGSF